MQLREIDPKELKPNPFNTNEVAPENMEKLKASLQRNGWVRPVVARRMKDGSGYEILGGQHRVEAATELGHDRVPVIVLDNVDDKRAKEIGLIDNARYGVDDAIGLAELMAELGGEQLGEFLPFTEADFAMLATDVEDEDIDDLIDGIGNEEEDDKEAPAKAPLKTHEVFRFKLPVESADDFRADIERVVDALGYDDSDAQINAGDALLWIVRAWKEGEDQ